MTGTLLEKELSDWIVQDTARGTAARRTEPVDGNAEPRPVGALRLWLEELRRGYRGQDPARFSTWRYDALHHAACCEANGEDALRSGLPRSAAFWFARASSILLEAAQKRRRSA
jgi:hypothetical protein